MFASCSLVEMFNARAILTMFTRLRLRCHEKIPSLTGERSRGQTLDGDSYWAGKIRTPVTSWLTGAESGKAGGRAAYERRGIHERGCVSCSFSLVSAVQMGSESVGWACGLGCGRASCHA